MAGTVSIPAFAGYLGLFAWVFLAEAGVPLLVPTELLLIAGGVAAARNSASLGTVALVALAGDLLGTATLFTLVRGFAGRPELAPTWLARPISWATAKARLAGGGSLPRIAIARSIPFLRIPAAGAAGLVELGTLPFLAAALVGGIVWVALFVGGAYFVAAGLLPVD